MISERAKRLSARFSAIQQGIAQIHGQDRAFVTSIAAWLQIIQYAMKETVLKAVQNPDTDTANFEKEIQEMLQSIHEELCEYLDVSPEEALDLSVHFNEIIQDICQDKG